MKIVQAHGNLVSYDCDGLVLGLGSEWETSSQLAAIDSALGGTLRKLVESEELSTKPMKVTSLLSPTGIQARQLVIVGLGNNETRDAGIGYRAAATGAKAMAASKNRKRVAYAGFYGDDLYTKSSVIGSITGGVGQDLFRAERSLHAPEEVHWFDVSDAILNQGLAIGQSMNLTRRLVNLPPNYLYPETFANEASVVAREVGLEIEIWDQKRLKVEKCGALLAVSQGSTKEPRLCILKYAGTNPSIAPIALVGKGVTFDSGGLSIKPTEGMLTMKCDMAGAATVLGIMRSAALLQLEQPIIGLVGLVENLISGDAFKLGDVVTARSGKTIEIHNTDAEGRLVLADVLNVALQHNPSHIIDFATLTGACVVALGNDVVGAMSNNDHWQQKILDAVGRCGEYAWPLPMYSFFAEQIAGKVADIKNVGEGRWGGAITAAKFLEEFVGKTPWTHLDIAGPAFLDSPKSWTDAGATATMVRSVIELLSSIDS
ncbi:MAG: leucyl aminopeptidase [Pirellulaceae bacterium]|nr:leucyl aminopeptidase [Pirellulaceae bacterium]